MLKRPSRWHSVILSPGVSVIVAVLGALLMIGSGSGWIFSIAISGAIASLMVMEIKARMLFKGPNFPFAALFMMFQAMSAQSVPGCALALMTSAGLITAPHSFMRTDRPRLLFTLFMICGAGALWFRGFALIVPGIILMLITVRGLSLRGVVASLLGVLTAAILLLATQTTTLAEIAAVYSAPWFTLPPTGAYSRLLAATIASVAVTFLAGLVMYLPSYGYPAKQRARNMAVLVMSGVAILLPVVDYSNASMYLPVINFCAAYHVTHLAAVKQFGWVFAVLSWILAATLIAI